MPAYNRIDPIALLERSDKWQLGGGRAAVFAPVFPKYLDTLGFWDEAHFADVRLERLFCLLLLNAQGRPVPLQRVTRRWTPDRLTQIYIAEGYPYLQILEERVLTPNDTLACKLTLQNRGTEATAFHLLLWSLQTRNALTGEGFETSAEELERDLDAFSFAHRIQYGGTSETPAEVYGWGEREEQGTPAENPAVFVALGGSRLPDSWTANLAETSDTAPLWQTSPFPEKFREGLLAGDWKWEAGWNPKGHLHLGLHYTVEIPQNSTESLTFGASLALNRETALDNLRSDMITDVTAESERNWRDFFESVPYFECSDPHLQRYYWYRWYGLRLMTVHAGAGQLPYPCVFEGAGAFRSHISYSAQCHIRETSWMPDKTLAKGCLYNFLANQFQDESEEEDGFIPGHLYLWRRDRGFYHADWGGVALQIYNMTGDLAFVESVYPYLTRYATYFDRVRDREGSHLYDVLDQGETGQEYMSRYLFVDSQADAWRKIQIKAVDATCYQFRLQQVLAVFAGVLGKESEQRVWSRKSDATRNAIRTRLWDAKEGIFKDAHPQTGTLSPYKAAVGFYPLMYDIGQPHHLAAMQAHLENPQTFGTPFPAPASSADDPFFDAEAEWKGKRTNCPWNGRVWPMTNSHISAAFAHSSRYYDPEAREAAANFTLRYIKMLFHEGDSKLPNSYEHYNPQTGVPSLYRGIDDYQHSWIVDIILQQVAGILPEPGFKGKLIVDPLPFPLSSFRVEGVFLRGHWLDVVWSEGEGLTVYVDGAEREHRAQRERMEIELEA